MRNILTLLVFLFLILAFSCSKPVEVSIILYPQTPAASPAAFWPRRYATPVSTVPASPFLGSPQWNTQAQASNLSFFQGKVSPEPEKTFGDYLSRTSMTAQMLANLLLFSSPLIAKGAAQAVARHPKHLFPKKHDFLKKMQNPQYLKEQLQRLISFSNLFQLNTGLQVGIYTQQPSKLLATCVGAFRETSQIIRPAGFWQSIAYLSSFFWFAGETNDIRNTTDPGHRREWNPKRLLSMFSPNKANGSPSFGNELSSLVKYIADDFKYALSLKPWKDLRRSLQEKSDWTVPQSYQTAIGAQFNLLAFLGSIGALVSEHLKIRENPTLKELAFNKWDRKLQQTTNNWRLFTKINAACGIISYMPVAARALLNWKEAESILTLLGIPLTTSFMVLQASRDISTHKGFFSLGSPMINEGKRINGKKYRAQVNYLIFLYQKALQNPQLTALDVWKFLKTHPNELKAMELHMGNFRVDYILKTLETGIRQQRTQRISLAQYLYPLTQMKAS